MSLGRSKEQQRSMWLSYDQLPQSKGHVFYERLQKLLRQEGFDAFLENLCAPFYAERLGRRSIPPGRYFRMLLIGYFEGIDSERGICWRCSDSLSLREFLGLAPSETVPDHSSLCRIRQRLPLEVHHETFVFVLRILEQANLLHGRYLGIDASTMEANAAMKSIVRRDTGEGYEAMLVRLAEESGIKTPTRAELIAFDRKRKGKKTSNKDWQSTTDEESRITRLKDGRTHMAYKPEHVVDLESGAIVSAVIHPADQGDRATITTTLEDAQAKLCAIREKEDAPGIDDPFDLVADKGYHSREVLKSLPESCCSRISEPKHKGRLRWHGDLEARDAVYTNRARLKSYKSKVLLRVRAERVERSFAHCLDRGGMRRSFLRGLENIEKRYIIHLAGFNLGILLRALFGFGTPKGLADARAGLIFARIGEMHLLILAVWLPHAAEAPDLAMIVFLRWNP
ncbi:MAG: transposase [Desulfobulbus sp.]|jgi:transposase